jgi:hypothetical protein
MSKAGDRGMAGREPGRGVAGALAAGILCVAGAGLFSGMPAIARAPAPAQEAPAPAQDQAALTPLVRVCRGIAPLPDDLTACSQGDCRQGVVLLNSVSKNAQVPGTHRESPACHLFCLPSSARPPSF